jgi:hypothetical protein
VHNTSEKTYTPNHISTKERTQCILFSVGLLIYGTIGVVRDDLYIPGKRSRGMHFHGIPCWIMYFAFLFAAANLISVVVDHYDSRNNETNYKKFANLTRRIGWVLFITAIIADLLVFCQATRY